MALALVGCDESPPKPERLPHVDPRGSRVDQVPSPPPKLRAELEKLEQEAGLLEPEDPPAPSGDLKSDVESFTTLDACARARAPSDPVLSDAIESIGYEGLVRDSCRVLQALKTRDVGACRPIVASALRARCESSVAILVGTPALCPVNTASGRLSARDPVCLARASRDERLCAAALPSDRPTCEALVTADPLRCGGKPACVRQVARWGALVEKPKAHTAYPARFQIEVKQTEADAAAASAKLDLTDVAQSGVVVSRLATGRTKLALGTPRSALWPAWQDPTATPRIYVEVSLSQSELGKGEHALGPSTYALDLLVPKLGLLSGVTATEVKVEDVTVASDVGGTVHLALSAAITDAPRSYSVKLDLTSFVRDVVAPASK